MLSARPEECFAENQFLLQTELCFLYEFSSCTDFFVPWQIGYLGESKQQCTCLDENISKIYFEKMFSLNCLYLELRNLCFLGRSKGRFCKTLAYVSERENFQKEKIFGHLTSHHFWKLTRNNLEFTGQNLTGMSKMNPMCPEEHMESFVFERKSLKFQVFRKSNEVCATVAKLFLQVCKTEKNVQRNKLRKSLSEKGKKY